MDRVDGNERQSKGQRKAVGLNRYGEGGGRRMANRGEVATGIAKVLGNQGCEEQEGASQTRSCPVHTHKAVRNVGLLALRPQIRLACVNHWGRSVT